MLNQAHVEQAHDALIAVLETERIPMDPAASQYISACLDVLCWLLEHAHNPNFERNLAMIAAALADAQQPEIVQ